MNKPVMPFQGRLSLWRARRRLLRQANKQLGYSVNIDAPKTFNEKIQHRKLYGHDPIWPILQDKIDAKKFVAEKLGPEWITPSLWQGDRLPPLANRKWPIPYVIKASHGCRMNVFIRSESDIDWPSIESRCAVWLATDISKTNFEWAYSQLSPRILVEPFIGENGALPEDYKLHCFGGRVLYIQVDTEREKGTKRVLFDRNWQRQPFSHKYPLEMRRMKRPRCLAEMISAAEIISRNIDYIRVDFYQVGGKAGSVKLPCIQLLVSADSIPQNMTDS